MTLAYFTGLGLIILLAGGAVFLTGAAGLYLDPVGFLAIFCTSQGALICNFGPRGSLTALLSLVRPGLAAGGFRKSAAKTVIMSALFGGLFYSVLGIIAALANLADPAAIGQPLASGLLALLYGSLLATLAVPAYVAGD